ncbi:MAG: hypothetical protein PHH09_02605 [Methanoregulaceae archaeon]|nr:hypothetical protein [Methanoregulaceae archaeon]
MLTHERVTASIRKSAPMPGRAMLTAEPSNGVIKLAIAAIRRTIRLVAGDSAPAGSGTLPVRIEERDSPEKKNDRKEFFGSSLPGIGRIDKQYTFCGGDPPPHPRVRCYAAAPEGRPGGG